MFDRRYKGADRSPAPVLHVPNANMEGMKMANFPFLERPARSAKPRRSGLTVVSDMGLSLAETRSLIETAGDIVDHVKITDHVGILWRYPEEWVQQKTAFYRQHGIETLVGGIPFEVALLQGKVPQYMRRVAELGFDGVEVSEDSVDALPPAQRRAAIRHGLDCGLKVFTEMGMKIVDAPLEAAEAIDLALRDLEDGAYLVVVEKSDIAVQIAQKRDTLHRLIEGVPQEKLIFEAGPGADEMQVAGWLIREFGSEVNLENLRAANAITLEAMRHGLNRAVDYRYFHAFAGKPLPPVT